MTEAKARQNAGSPRAADVARAQGSAAAGGIATENRLTTCALRRGVVAKCLDPRSRA